VARTNIKYDRDPLVGLRSLDFVKQISQWSGYLQNHTLTLLFLPSKIWPISLGFFLTSVAI